MLSTFSRQVGRRASASRQSARRFFTGASSSTSTRAVSKTTATATAAGLTLVAIAASYHDDDKYAALAARVPTSGDVLSVGTPIKEVATGILFPQLCNGFQLAGTGVRIKYVFVKVYAVGSYFDPVSLMAVKNGNKEEVERALLDPTYPRCIRVVMNRALSIEKYTDGIVESLEPRMKGQDLEKLEEFKKLNPPVDLVEGAEIEMTIRGDTLLYKNAVGGVQTLRSRVLTEALCDVYYGSDPVSPPHKEAVIAGIPKL